MKIPKILKISAVAGAIIMACNCRFNGQPGILTVYAEPNMPDNPNMPDDSDMPDNPGEDDNPGEPSASGKCGENATWNYYDGTKELLIEGTGALNDYTGYSSLPWNSVADSVKTIKVGEGVTKIGRFALSGFKNVTSVSLPSSLKTIEFNAFYLCPSLEELSMYDKVEDMDVTAFTYCEKLKEITLNVSDSTTATGNGTTDFSLPQEIMDKGISVSKFLAQDGISIKNESGNDIIVNGVKIENGSSYPHTHAFLDKYETSPEGHRQVCGCGALSVTEEHEYGLMNSTKEEKLYKCSVCGFEKKETVSGSKKDTGTWRIAYVYYICLAVGTIVVLICALGIILINTKKRELKKRLTRRKKRMTGASREENPDSKGEI